MWRIEQPEFRPGTLDFTSSGQGWRKVQRLFADGIELINAVELVDWGEGDTQFAICNACGMVGCKQGGWVRVRRSGSLVLILPALDYVWAERAEDKTEYHPPQFLKQRGIACFDRSTYETLSAQHASIPPFERVPHLNMREATLIFHWQAPAEVLGPPPEVRVRHELIVGASEGSAAEWLSRIEELIRSQYQDESPALLRPLLKTEVSLSIYLDASEFIDWKALAIEGDNRRLIVDSTFVIASGGS